MSSNDSTVRQWLLTADEAGYADQKDLTLVLLSASSALSAVKLVG